MKKIFPVVLSLFVLFAATKVQAENDMNMMYAAEQSKRYLFIGCFKKVKDLRHNSDTIMLEHNNTGREIFVGMASGLIEYSLSQSMRECLGNLSSPYDGRVAIVSSIARVNGLWIALRSQDATCKRLPSPH